MNLYLPIVGIVIICINWVIINSNKLKRPIWVATFRFEWIIRYLHRYSIRTAQIELSDWLSIENHQKKHSDLLGKKSWIRLYLKNEFDSLKSFNFKIFKFSITLFSIIILFQNTRPKNYFKKFYRKLKLWSFTVIYKL